MKLLFIDDNRRLVESMKNYLSQYFVVDTAYTAEDGIQKALVGAYSVVLLDLSLPDQSGFEVCKTLRETNVQTPILVLTGSGDQNTCVKMLDCGADDYLTKPFRTAELRARISALGRRNYQYTPKIIQVEDLIIDVGRRHVQRSGKTIALRRKEFDILEYLITNRGRAVTRAMIMDHAWESGKDSWNNTVDVHIKHLRDKVDRPFGSSLIKTAYGIGYMVDDAAL